VTDTKTAPAALTERGASVLLITITARGAQRINGAVSIRVGDALQAAQTTPDVRAVVITGAVNHSAHGADLKAYRGGRICSPDQR